MAGHFLFRHLIFVLFPELLINAHLKYFLDFFQCAKFLDDQSILQWQQYTRKRMRLMENPTNQTTSAGNEPQSSAVSVKQEEIGK